MAFTFDIPPAFYSVSAAFILFRVLHGLRGYLPVPNSLVRSVDGSALERKLWQYHNIVMSFFHSTVTAVLSVLCFVDEPRMLSDLINTKTTLSYLMLVFSTGYFIHDLIEVVKNDFSNQTGLVLHHILVCGAFGLALFGDIYYGFATCSLLMEISSIFLHSRRLLLFSGFGRRSMPFKVNGLFLLVTFICFRFLTSAWMTNFVIRNRDSMPFSHFLQGAINMAVVTVINVILLMRICNSDFRKGKQTKEEE